MKTWHAFSFLIIAAIAYYYAGKLILVLAALYLLFRGWMWLGWHYPGVVWFIIGFFRGLR